MKGISPPGSKNVQNRQFRLELAPGPPKMAKSVQKSSKNPTQKHLQFWDHKIDPKIVQNLQKSDNFANFDVLGLQGPFAAQKFNCI